MLPDSFNGAVGYASAIQVPEDCTLTLAHAWDAIANRPWPILQADHGLQGFVIKAGWDTEEGYHVRIRAIGSTMGKAVLDLLYQLA